MIAFVGANSVYGNVLNDPSTATGQCVIGGFDDDDGPINPITVPASWSQVANVYASGDGGNTAVVDTVVSNPGAGLTFQASFAPCLALAAYSGVNLSNPINAITSVQGSGVGTGFDIIADSITTTVDGCRIVIVVCLDVFNQGFATTYTPSSGFSQRAVSPDTSAEPSNIWVQVAIFDAAQVSAGATGAITTHLATAGNMIGWVVYTIALEPSADTPAPLRARARTDEYQETETQARRVRAIPVSAPAPLAGPLRVRRTVDDSPFVEATARARPVAIFGTAPPAPDLPPLLTRPRSGEWAADELMRRARAVPVATVDNPPLYQRRRADESVSDESRRRALLAFPALAPTLFWRRSADDTQSEQPASRAYRVIPAAASVPDLPPLRSRSRPDETVAPETATRGARAIPASAPAPISAPLRARRLVDDFPFPEATVRTSRAVPVSGPLPPGPDSPPLMGRLRPEERASADESMRRARFAPAPPDGPPLRVRSRADDAALDDRRRVSAFVQSTADYPPALMRRRPEQPPELEYSTRYRYSAPQPGPAPIAGTPPLTRRARRDEATAEDARRIRYVIAGSSQLVLIGRFRASVGSRVRKVQVGVVPRIIQVVKLPPKASK